jgi:hypothetical protein
MSEFQRYEFMTVDRPLTREQLDAVNRLSSHIDATSTQATIEYHWGNFKHDPIKVLHQYFDGFLYWANWGTPRLAFRFPHGLMQTDLIDGYDLDEFVTFTRHDDYDILDIRFTELEAPDEWTDYELGSLIALRDEMLDGDTRALYIIWLASRRLIGSYDEEEDYEIAVPPVPLGFSTLSPADQALAELLQVPRELLAAAARHSQPQGRLPVDDVTSRLGLLPPDRRDDYLVRLARNEPGLSRLLIRELGDVGRDSRRDAPPPGEHVTYATLLGESEAIRAQRAREQREQERLARERHLRDIHDHQDDFWRQVDGDVARGSGTGYDEATHLLTELREAANQFGEAQQFEERFSTWVQPHLRRPALVKRLRDSHLPVPVA